MEVRTKPDAVVVTTDQAALTVPVMVTVSLALSTRPEHGAALSPRHHRPPGDAGAGGGGGDHWLLTAVIFRMVIFSELETVVTSTHQVSLAASVAIVLTSVPRSVTVSLSFVTGLVWGTTSPAIVVPPRTPLTWPRLGGDTGTADTRDEEQEETQPDAELSHPGHLTKAVLYCGATCSLL